MSASQQNYDAGNSLALRNFAERNNFSDFII